MKINAVITGATGMVGKGVLLECLDHPDVRSVLVINRRPLGMQHEKLKEIVQENLLDLSPSNPELKGYNACFYCAGPSSAGMSEEDYTRVTYDICLHVARTLIQMNPDMVFNYVSGTGTDSELKSRMMWARVKGRTENALLELPFKDAYMWRPGIIQPLRGVTSRVKMYNALYIILRPLFPILHLVAPDAVTTTVRVGKAMIIAVLKGSDKKHLYNKDINKLATALT